MDVLIILVFVSLVLVTAAVLLFIMRVREGDLDHGERLSLLPLDEAGEREGACGDRTARPVPPREPREEPVPEAGPASGREGGDE